MQAHLQQPLILVVQEQEFIQMTYCTVYGPIGVVIKTSTL